VNLPAILDWLVSYLRRFVAFAEPGQVEAIALWVVHTWLFRSVQPETTMYVAVTSPEPESGKSRLLEALELVVADPLYAFNLSPAALYRVIDQRAPMLLFDEIDAVFGRRDGNEDIRAILNAGYRKGAQAFRVRDRSGGLDAFNVYCPKALAGIGNLPDTITSRSIPIRLRRRSSSEPVEPFYRREVADSIAPVIETLRALAIPLPPKSPRVEGLGDRASDGWEILFRIADAAGGPWPQRAREAALALHSRKPEQRATQGVQMLTDLRAIFEDTQETRTTTATLIDRLCEIEESPWGDWYGKRITSQGLAKLLKPYGIRPRQWRDSYDGVCRGYVRSDFEDAWTRYLPESVSSTPATNGTSGTGAVAVPVVTSVPAAEETDFFGGPGETTL
jgi:hypothetical protein